MDDYHGSFAQVVDACVGYVRLHNLFPAQEIPCIKTLYTLLWKGEIPLTLFELPKVLSRRTRNKPRIPKRFSGKSIDLRPKEVAERTTFVHWDSDTVIKRKRKGNEQGMAALLVMIKNSFYIRLTIYTMVPFALYGSIKILTTDPFFKAF